MGNQRNQQKTRRVVLFPSPLQGHINPMVQLANILHTRGFSITIIHTNFNSPNTKNYPHFTFNSISDGLSEHEDATEDAISFMVRLNSNCVETFRDCLARLLSDDTSDEPISCLITDAAWHFSQSVADDLKLPRIVLRTSSISSFLAYAAFPFLLEKGYLPKQDSRLNEPIQELSPLKVKDLPSIITRNIDDLYNLIGSMVKEAKVSSGIIWNSFEELEHSTLVTVRQDFPVPSFLIGPFHEYFKASSSSLLAQDQSSISWLEKQAPKSVLYVSFGSIAAIDENEFLEMAWGIANSEQPFLWVVRPGLVHGSKWLESLPSEFINTIGERGHIVKWAPQQEVLAHKSLGGFWTHNGWNSTLESICEGVPMMCSPRFGDQMVNARYVTDVWKVGLGFDNGLERETVEKTIRRLLVEREGEELRERVRVLKEKVNHCLMKGGSSHKNLDALVNYILSLRF